jgi:hypothetical protein
MCCVLCGQVDDWNPLQREWSLLCVGNLCEGNTRVQAAIASLRAQEVAVSPQLAALGVKAEVADGKVRVWQDAPTTAASSAVPPATTSAAAVVSPRVD